MFIFSEGMSFSLIDDKALYTASSFSYSKNLSPIYIDI